MPNTIKYSTTGDTFSLKKGNFFIGTGDVGKGPSNVTKTYNGVSPVVSGYTVYQYNASQQSNISFYSANNDAELITFTNSLSGQTFTSVTQCFNWYATQTNNVCVNRDYESIVTNGLVLNVDAGFIPSYSRSGTTMYDLSYSGDNCTLINGPTYSGTSGGLITFDGTDDYGTLSSAINFTDGSPFTTQCFISIPYFTGQNLNRVHWISGSGGNSMMIFNSTTFSMWNEAGGVNSLSISYSFPTNQIFHATITRDSNNVVSLYVNGIYINQGSRSGQFRWLNIAILGSATIYCSKFNLYNMMIYNRAITSSEVLQNYQAQFPRFLGKNIVTNGLVEYLDASYINSYPTTGTTWTNISGLSGGTGTLTNGPTYSTDGGGSIVFDGVDDYFTTSNYNDIVFGNGDFSANIWMKFPISSVGEGGAWGPIISKGCTTSAPAGTWWVAQNSTNTNSVALNISSTAGGTFVCSLNSGSLNNGWNNVFVMRQGSTSSMYINGVFRQSDNTSESNLQSTRPLTLCATFTTNITTQRTNASLSSVMLYNRALMPSEIFQNYQAQLPTILGENIITNGLVLYLDAGYRTSYPTSGTSWGNVSGVSGFTGTLTNGPTYNSGNGGSIVFDGTDDRVFGNQLPLNSPYSFTNGNFTLEHWIKPTAYQAGSYFGLTNMILSKGPASTFNYATQVTNSTTLSFISRNNAEGLKYLNFTVPSLTNSITHIVFAVSFSQVSLFINGILSEVKNLTGNPITPYNNDSINIGGEGNTNTFFTGNMYIHRIYNRMLSSLEIQQNFNAQKSRFGL